MTNQSSIRDPQGFVPDNWDGPEEDKRERSKRNRPVNRKFKHKKAGTRAH